MEDMNLILWNSFVLIFSLWFILYTNRNFIYKTRINRRRFKLFALRDELTILAMKGHADYNSEEYQFLLKSLNSLIRITGDFHVTDFLKFIATVSPSSFNEIYKIEEKLNKETNGLHLIWVRYCQVMNQIMSGHLKLIIWVLVVIAGAFKSIRICTNIASNFVEKGRGILSSSAEIRKIAESET
ncbi:hypothetical protein [Desulfobacter postgatei]|jgi:hypothetical protein|uniref:hypothetical protein n=1 Tax=Desulfobacter postgatei TaxID=2293 RepID=UPI002A35C745|nr:hypothetical protein [Desulfobacter postgatei]MDX9963546.1 hypothetical protein [Desulfobacter postgatei]